MTSLADHGQANQVFIIMLIVALWDQACFLITRQLTSPSCGARNEVALHVPQYTARKADESPV